MHTAVNVVEPAAKLAYKNLKVFTTTDEILGLPAQLFILGCALAVILAILSFWWFAPLILLLYFPVMYSIHKDDPRAIRAWLRAIRRKHNTWQAGKISAMHFNIF